MTIEETCTKLNPGDAEEFMAETSRLLKQKQPPNTPTSPRKNTEP